MRIIVIDENDNVPEFDSLISENIEISDTTATADVLWRFSAQDLDEGLNGHVRYLLTDDKSKMLDLDPDTGNLIFAR